MKRWGRWMAAGPAMVLILGCVDIRQDIYVNHDGSGKIVERFTMTARGYRLMKGLQKRTGETITEPALLSDEFLQKRSQSMGEVKLAGKKEETLPDGRKAVEATYTFSQINKVHVWMIPTMKYKKKFKGGGGDLGELDGRQTFGWEPKRSDGGSTYREILSFPALRACWLPTQPLMSPAERQEYLDVLPVYQDLLKDFSLTIAVVAPIETFEEPGMYSSDFMCDSNRVTIFNLRGKDLAESPEALRQFASDEIPSGGTLDSEIPRMVLNSICSLWFNNYGGHSIRFLKVERTTN